MTKPSISGETYKTYEIIVIEKLRTGYIVTAKSEAEVRHLIEHPEQSYQETFSEYYDVDSIESIEEQS